MAFWMASHLGACSPALMCRKVITEKPTPKEIHCRISADSTFSQPNTGLSSRENTGSPIHPRPRLASVMPNCAALRNASNWPRIRLAALARRWPRRISTANCVSRTLTRANSDATKKAFMSRTRKFTMLRSRGTSFRGAAMILADVRPMMNPRMPPIMTLSATRRPSRVSPIPRVGPSNPARAPTSELPAGASVRRAEAALRLEQAFGLQDSNCFSNYGPADLKIFC